MELPSQLARIKIGHRLDAAGRHVCDTSGVPHLTTTAQLRQENVHGGRTIP
jgi:hypothetical protein